MPLHKLPQHYIDTNQVLLNIKSCNHGRQLGQTITSKEAEQIVMD